MPAAAVGTSATYMEQSFVSSNVGKVSIGDKVQVRREVLPGDFAFIKGTVIGIDRSEGKLAVEFYEIGKGLCRKRYSAASNNLKMMPRRQAEELEEDPDVVFFNRRLTSVQEYDVDMDMVTYERAASAGRRSLSRAPSRGVLRHESKFTTEEDDDGLFDRPEHKEARERAQRLENDKQSNRAPQDY